MMGSFALLEMDGGSIVLVHSPSEAQEEEGINAVSAAALLPSGSYMVHSQTPRTAPYIAPPVPFTGPFLSRPLGR